jgi:hypothetical protein
MTEKIVFKGSAALYMAGIPARDLSPAEWAEVSPELQAKALHLGLYEVIEVNPKNEQPAKAEG